MKLFSHIAMVFAVINTTATVRILCAVEHPLSREVCRDTKYEVLIGNREWMGRNSISVPADVDQLMADHERQGQTAVLAAVSGKSAVV